jgi:hypothetical protein
VRKLQKKSVADEDLTIYKIYIETYKSLFEIFYQMYRSKTRVTVKKYLSESFKLATSVSEQLLKMKFRER